MSESAPRINPSNVFPRRNLPGEAEQWGRIMEDRTRELERNAVSVNQSLHGANRGTAAQLAAISEQLSRLNETNVIKREEFYVDNNSFDETRSTTLVAPDWANYAHVSASYLAKTSSPYSKRVISGVSVMVEDDGSSQFRQEIMFGLFIHEGGHWMPGSPPSPSVVDLGDTLRQVNITDHVRVEDSGTGSIDITSFYFITFIK